MLVVGYGFEGEDVDGKKYWIVKNRSVENVELCCLELEHFIRIDCNCTI